MANGDPVFVNSQIRYEIKFLDGQTPASSSPWRDVSKYPNRSFYVDPAKLDAPDSVQIMARDDPGDTPPDTLTDGEVILTLTSVPGANVGNSMAAHKWWKAKKIVGVGGGLMATNCTMTANRPQ